MPRGRRTHHRFVQRISLLFAFHSSSTGSDDLFRSLLFNHSSSDSLGRFPFLVRFPSSSRAIDVRPKLARPSIHPAMMLSWAIQSFFNLTAEHTGSRSSSARGGRTLKPLVRFFSIRLHWCRVFGIGVAVSRGYTVATDDWAILVRLADWKVYLGPVMITGTFPYCATAGRPPTYCKPNARPVRTTDPLRGRGTHEAVVGDRRDKL